ncbi:nucleotidyltransferase family protein [Defluviimonas sp. D31]|uniref:nucleotidyltransferase family protein n=1 Tax=Defluviimonas sp. D31 TaxID=3083253 RepID=UPI00296F43D8|nr:nucleotidyltransferase family protein [Defluviimonas sp. D31]
MRQLPDTLMLFTAGLGTRMRALTTTRPKPLIEVAGRALLDHALAQVDGAGVGQIVANLHYLPDQIRTHLAHRPELRFSDETETILETGGGLRHALPLLGSGAVFTLNTDAVWTGPNALAQLRAGWDPARMDGLLLLVPRERATGHTGSGDFDLDAEGRLSRGRGYVYTGAQILKSDGLAEIPDQVFSLNRLWDRMLAEGRLYGAVHDGGWCDVGRPEAIPLAEALLKEAERDV